MKLTLATIGALAPLAVQANVGLGWSFTGVPCGGLKDITFPINMQHATHASGYYFAQQFKFKNMANVGYMGLQPREDDASGNSVVHAAFSSFQKGTTTTHPNCYDGADGGSGVSCALEINGPYNVTYNLIVENVSGTTWRGLLVNSVSGESNVIGEWTLPAGAGKIQPSQVGFVEYYPWNRPEGPDCPNQPKTEVVFGFPTSTVPGVTGTISKPYDYGDCKGAFTFAPQQAGNSWDVHYGVA